MPLFEAENTQRTLMDQEERYAQDWRVDADNFMGSNLYGEITGLVEPKNGETTVDVGTGMGYQLIALAEQNGMSNVIGTERTRANVFETYKHMQAYNLARYFSLFSDSELSLTEDGRVYWKRGSGFTDDIKDRLRSQLEHKILLLDDNILYPQILPAVLPDGKLQAGILSMPGGSSNRALEWPFYPAELDDEQHLDRTTEISDATRKAFYRFMAEYMEPGNGRIVIAERMLSDPSVSQHQAGIGMIGRQMQSLRKYWKPMRGGIVPVDFSGTQVDLKATDAKGKVFDAREKHPSGAISSIVVARFDRTNVPFDEPPQERPIPEQRA